LFYFHLIQRIVLLDNHHGGVGDTKWSSLLCMLLEEDDLSLFQIIIVLAFPETHMYLRTV
jgi:hypothetical protein